MNGAAANGHDYTSSFLLDTMTSRRQYLPRCIKVRNHPGLGTRECPGQNINAE